MKLKVPQRIAQLVIAYADSVVRTQGLNVAGEALAVAEFFDECSKTPDTPLPNAKAPKE